MDGRTVTYRSSSRLCGRIVLDRHLSEYVYSPSSDYRGIFGGGDLQINGTTCAVPPTSDDLSKTAFRWMWRSGVFLMVSESD